ncbi:hypothetical protein M427DRAFT_193100 [Gonapodya prolifera JEL478]|uniref:Uncharacterized protein n=1 Tax=Gonapodya prolifera (strain JEL478) TaxID=1344416 RepID=A0A139A034_GONPJ|nr:hypothetical protein M427DRAFT_193100 [Gonapodya prolifera JEL478]|eukprot:KXS09998.1 hypothetical protein M427DRAFT_193100 [Gonapodya prolifera JEL478]
MPRTRARRSGKGARCGPKHLKTDILRFVKTQSGAFLKQKNVTECSKRKLDRQCIDAYKRDFPDKSLSVDKHRIALVEFLNDVFQPNGSVRKDTMDRLQQELQVVLEAYDSPSLTWVDFLRSQVSTTFLPIVQVAIPNWLQFMQVSYCKTFAMPIELSSLVCFLGFLSSAFGLVYPKALAPMISHQVKKILPVIWIHFSSNHGVMEQAMRDLLDFKNQQLKENKRKRPDGQIGNVAFKEAKN